MTTRSTLPFVLEGASPKAELDAEQIDSDRARIAARFWAGKYEGSHAKAACVERITAVWREPKRVEQVLATLRPEERTVLSVVKRFGGSISGALLQRELLARGVLRERDPDEPVRFGRNQLSADPVSALCERLVLIKEPGYHSYWSYGPLREYPDVSLPKQFARFVSAAPSLTWKASRAVRAPDTSTLRTPTQMLVDLCQTARALEGQGVWRTNQGGALPGPTRNRLGKLCAAVATDPFAPPDRVALDYSILSALGAIEHADGEAWLVRACTDHFWSLPPEAQTSAWVRAWHSLRLWQDGIGAVPERDSENNPTRIDPDRLKRGRELLVWALSRVAHSEGDEWLDLETFLLDLHAAAGDRGVDFYWHGFAWQPRFESAARKDELPAGPKRMRAFWMDQEGVWAANALLSTLVHLGVVERGRTGKGPTTRWSFRLTDIGKAVLGAPEIAFKQAVASDKCLTVQPNHDVLLYLDAADGKAISTLGRIASQVSTAGPVLTFKLTRESVYGALEAGMAPAAIESFLSSKSRSDLPANVAQSLAEWSRKREAIVVRTDVDVVFLPGNQENPGRAIGSHFFLGSPATARKVAKHLVSGSGSGSSCRDWKVDEHGVVTPRAPMSMVGKARLRRFAQCTGGTWKVSAQSVRAGKELGIDAEQMLDWLTAHASEKVPSVLAMAIRNWAGGRTRVFVDRVVLLQVADPEAFAALNQSVRLRPHIKGVLAPGSFVVTEGGREEAKRVLCDLGLSLDAECKLRPPGEVASGQAEADQMLQLLKLHRSRTGGHRKGRSGR